MENLPIYIKLIFGLTTFLTMYLFLRATPKPKTIAFFLLAWLTIQSILGLSGFYTVTDAIPPRFLFLVMPPIMITIRLFATTKGRKFIDTLDIKTLTILHTIRIPVELVLFWLFIEKTVPQLMTFEGRNLDVLSGLTAPLVYYFGFVQKKLNTKIILIWNFICLGLLFNIVINAVLSVPTPFQKFGFEQPNIALLYFPFIWLPCCIVPIVLFAHLVAIRQLLNPSQKISSEKGKEEKITPLVNSLSGIINPKEDFDYKKDYSDYLINKFNAERCLCLKTELC